MHHHIFTVYDTAAEYYMPPFYMQSKGEALRAFMDTASDPQHPFSKHPADFNLFHIGTFDNATATFQIFPAPISLGNALELRKPNETQLFENEVAHQKTNGATDETQPTN